MSSAERRQLRAVLYRGLADAATGLAAASLLDNVREKHERAALRWGELAELDEREAQLRAPAQ